MRKSLTIFLLLSLLATFAGPGLWLHERLDHGETRVCCHSDQVATMHTHDHARQHAPPSHSENRHPVSQGHHCELCLWLTCAGWEVSPQFAVISGLLARPIYVSPANDQVPHPVTLLRLRGRDPPGTIPIVL